MQAAFHDQRRTAAAAEGVSIEPIFRHAILCPAIQAPDDHVVQLRMASAAYGIFLKPRSGNTIFCSTVKTTNDDIVRIHGKTQILVMFAML
jgi:hypothetical protein